MSARMLLPRPEIRIATDFGSRIVGDGPVSRRIPAACASLDRAATFAGLDPADAEHDLSCTFERNRDLVGLLLGNHDGHADSAIEGSRHLLRLEVTAFLEKRENQWESPAVRIYDRVAAFRQNTRYVLEKSAARDVGQAFDPPFLHERKKGAHVNPRRGEKHFAQGSPIFRREMLGEFPLLLLDDA